MTVNAPRILELSLHLAREVKGSFELFEPLARREIGNTNYTIIVDLAEAVLAAHAALPQEAPAPPQCAREPVAWLVTWPDGERSFYWNEPHHVPGNKYEPLFTAALSGKPGAEVSRPQCSHSRAKVWMYRDDDTWMLCPDCGSKWCEKPSPRNQP